MAAVCQKQWNVWERRESSATVDDKLQTVGGNVQVPVYLQILLLNSFKDRLVNCTLNSFMILLIKAFNSVGPGLKVSGRKNTEQGKLSHSKIIIKCHSGIHSRNHSYIYTIWKFISCCKWILHKCFLTKTAGQGAGDIQIAPSSQRSGEKKHRLRCSGPSWARWLFG